MWTLVFLQLFAFVLVGQAAAAKIAKADDEPPCTRPPGPDCKSTPLELSFVVDGSSSIWPGNFTFALNFIEDFVDYFEISSTAVRVSLVTYGEVVYAQDAFDFDTYDSNQKLRKAVSSVPYHSGVKTNTSGGIWYMLRQQAPKARPGIRHVVIVLTDGNSQEADLTKEAAEDARETGLEVLAIGVGRHVSAEELHNIASERKYVFMVSAYNMLEDIKQRLAYTTCAQPTEPVCKMNPMDLAFVIDSSASIGEGNFSVGMEFVKDFVDSFQINAHAVRVAVVTFGHEVFTDDAFPLERYMDKKELKDAIEKIEWRHGTRTETGQGIGYMRDMQMKSARPNAAHVCIVITDGESQEYEFTKTQAKAAQDDLIVMYAVGVGQVGKQLNAEELNNIAGDPERVLTADNYAQLNLLKEELTQKTCEGALRALEVKAARYRS